MGKREREPGGKEKWTKEGIQEDRGEMERKKGLMVGRSHFRSCGWLVGSELGSTFHWVSHGNSGVSLGSRLITGPGPFYNRKSVNSTELGSLPCVYAHSLHEPHK